jgi:colanic acid/amylovoran biosynthesis glycosyltransferase
MSIAYLTPVYPSPSTTFIRREIAAIESRGLVVHRFAMRRFPGKLVDEGDIAEERQTFFLLEAGVVALAAALLGTALTRPRRWAAALAMAVRLGLRSERGLIRHLIYLAEACSLRQQLVLRGARHVHAHFGSNAVDIALLCHLLNGTSYSFTIHGPEDFDAPRALGLREKIHDADFVAAVSQYARGQLYRWAALEDWNKIRVIHCGLDASSLPSVVAPISDQPRLVNIGRLAEQKGQLLLVEAAARLRDQGVEFELIIIGDGPMRSEIERQIDRFELRKQVRITGFLSNRAVQQELQAARALVLPSFAEGLPVVIMESLAWGRPVISTYIAGIPELVEHNVNGWLVPAGAIEPLVDAMAEALAASPAKLEEMGRNGAARVASQHNVYIEAGKLADLFLETGSKQRHQDKCSTRASEGLMAMVADVS